MIVIWCRKTNVFCSEKHEPYFMPIIGIAVPCYNEGKRLPVQAFLDFAVTHKEFIFCFVNDGSSDGTSDILIQMAAICPEQVTVINRKENKGKGESIREGMNYLMERYGVSYVGFIDADLATPLTEMKILADIMMQRNYSMVCGSRIKRMGAAIDRYMIRHIIGRIFATLISWSLRLPFYDTQCGAKLFLVADVREHIFDKSFLSRWLVDVEIVKRLQQKLGYEQSYVRIYEYPLNEWHEVGQSKINIADIFRIPLDLLRIHFFYR